MTGKEHSTRFMEQAPEWFLTLLGEARAIGSLHHDVLEGILGISKVLLSDPQEAFRLSQQLHQTIEVYKTNKIASETDSTQLMAMIESGTYPQEVCVYIQLLLNTTTS